MQASADVGLSASHREIARIALPMMASGITVPLLGLVDTAVTGHLDGPHYLSAVAAGSIVFTVLFMGLNFLRMGTTGITAQAFGAHNPQAMLAGLMQPLLLAAGLAALLLLSRSGIISLALELLQPDPLTAIYAQQYFVIRIWSAPAALANLAIIGWLLGMQNARGPLLITVIINLVNIVLDLVFVLGLGLAVQGVAAATVVSEYAGLLTAFWLLRRYRLLQAVTGSWRQWLEWPGIRRLLFINGNLLLRSLALMFCFAFMTAQGARMGTLTLATNALLMNFLYLLSYALDGIAHAAEALVGKAAGALDTQAVRRTVRRTLAWTALFALGFMLFYALAGGWVIDRLSDIGELRSNARQYLIWLAVLPLVAGWSFLYDGVYVGMTCARAMRQIMTGAALLLYLPAWYLLRDFGNHGLWAALLVFMAGRSIAMHLAFEPLLRSLEQSWNSAVASAAKP